MTRPSKILIAIPHWEGDRDQAFSAARLLADLENRHSEKADVLFMSRFDCPPAPKPVLDHVSRKFNTYSQVNRRRGVGWTHGANELFFGVMDWVYANNAAKKLQEYKAILWFEADACPTVPNWITDLHDAWDKSQQGKKPVKILGPLLSQPQHPLMPPNISHINAGALYSGDRAFLKWIAREVGGCTPQGGFDWAMAPRFMKVGWADCPAMKSWWRSKGMTNEILSSLIHNGVSFLHGVKDNSMLDLVRARFIR